MGNRSTWDGARRGLLAGLVVAVALASGCALKVLFPVATQHTGDWADSHGEAVKAAGGPTRATVSNGMTCNLCHTIARAADGSIPDSPGSGKTCFSCHVNGPDGMPHPSAWNHGAFVLDAGGYKSAMVKGQVCSTCHTTDRASDGTVPASPAAVTTCYTCHGNGPTGSPHAKGWNHRSFLRSNGGYLSATVAGLHCADCHTVARASDGSVPASKGATATCFSCHNGPRGEDD